MSSAVAFEALFNECYSKFYNNAFSIEISPKNLVTLTVIAMEVVELAITNNGDRQKSLVIKILQKYITNSQLSDVAEKYYLELIENGMISAIIEVIIASTKNRIGVNSRIIVKKSGCM